MSIHDNGGSPRSATTPNPDSLPDIGLRRRRGVRVTTAAAVALGLAIGGGAVASAATSGSSTSTSTPGTHAESHGGQEGRSGHDGFGGTPPAAMGTVASVGASTFTLTTRDNTTVTVEVGSSTTYLDHDVTSPSLADIKVGTRVAVFGTDTANTVTATRVAIGGPDSGPGGGRGGFGGHDGFGGTPPAAMGTVASVGASTFTLTTRDNTTVTVDVSSSTTYLEPGVSSASLADIKVGTRVAVFGTDTSNTVTATKVGIGTPPSGGDGPGHGPGPGDGDGDGGMGAPMSGSATGSTTSTSTNGPAVNA
jgi:preprotein translocase subunit YajC